MSDEIRTERDNLADVGTRGSVIAAVVLFGVAKGVPRDRLEEVTGLSLADLVDPEARLPDASLGAAWRLIGRTFPDQAPGLEMAAAAPLSLFGPLAQAARFAATRRDALLTFTRYHKALSGGLEMRLEEREDEVVLVLAHSQDAVDDGHGAESALGLGARIGREVIGTDEAVRRVEFAHAQHGPVSAYLDWFASPVSFDAGRNAVVFDRGLLSTPPSQPDPTMYRYIEAHLALVHQQLEEQSQRAPLRRVRAGIAELAQRSEYSAEALAKSLGMSLRALQRLTRANGSSVSALIEAHREATACSLLADRRLSVEQVAFLVGYSNDRAFRRAFQRWTGSSPAAFRAVQP